MFHPMPSLESASALSVVPEKSTVSPIALSDINSPQLKEVVAVWNRWRQDRPMPTRDEMAPRDLGRLLPNISVVKVVAGEDDYEFRIVGGAHTQAYGASHQGKRVSDVLVEAPGFGERLKACFDSVVSSREPIAYRGKVGRDVGNARFVWVETVFLPLGTASAGVDHVMVGTIYVPLGGVWPN